MRRIRTTVITRTIHITTIIGGRPSPSVGTGLGTHTTVITIMAIPTTTDMGIMETMPAIGMVTRAHTACTHTLVGFTAGRVLS